MRFRPAWISRLGLDRRTRRGGEVAWGGVEVGGGVEAGAEVGVFIEVGREVRLTKAGRPSFVFFHAVCKMIHRRCAFHPLPCGWVYR